MPFGSIRGGGDAAVPLSFITLETLPLPDALSCSHRPSGLPANGPDSLWGSMQYSSRSTRYIIFDILSLRSWKCQVFI